MYAELGLASESAYMMGRLLVFVRRLLFASVAAILLLTFVWPFLLSSDPADPRFRAAAIVTFVIFLGAVSVLAIAKLRRP